MTIFSFDEDYFRKLFPEFSDVVQYPIARLEVNWDVAACFLSPLDYGALRGECRFKALNFMTAHITKFLEIGGSDGTVAFVTSASIDNVSAGVLAPPVKSQLSYSLNKTPYGEMVLLLLAKASAGGFYIGGSNDKNLLRQGGGFICR